MTGPQLVRRNVDVIVTAGNPPTHAAKQASGTIPIVMGISADPVGDGLIASRSHPGGNVTGLTMPSVELTGKRLNLLKDAFPHVARVAVLWTREPFGAQQWGEAEAAARALNLQLDSLEVQGPADFEAVFEAASTGRPDAFTNLDGPALVAHRKPIIDFVAQRRLPAMFAHLEFVHDGGLMSYAVNFPDLFRRTAAYVDKILKGARPADLPVEQPTRYDFVINLRTARALGLTIPQSVLSQSTEIIQ
jgi:putative tryptophan/tyrosine transport system substrate-binding protein